MCSLPLDTMLLLLKAKKNLAFFAVLLLLLPLIPTLIYTAYLNHAVLKPFRRMKDFTRHIAMGDLDFPFPWTESTCSAHLPKALTSCGIS